jgi:hypothetical protein
MTELRRGISRFRARPGRRPQRKPSRDAPSKRQSLSCSSGLIASFQGRPRISLGERADFSGSPSSSPRQCVRRARSARHTARLSSPAHPSDSWQEPPPRPPGGGKYPLESLARTPLEPGSRPALVIAACVRWPPENAGVGIVNRNGAAASSRPSARGAAVASTVLWPCPLRAVPVDVSEIPCLPRHDQPAAPGARHNTRRDTRRPTTGEGACDSPP